MADFKLVSDFQPSGDQPGAIDELVDGIKKNLNHPVYDWMITSLKLILQLMVRLGIKKCVYYGDVIL